MLPLVLLFTLLPLAELWLLFQLSYAFGFWASLAIVLGTGIAGAALARWQGFQALQRLQTELQQGAMPAKTIADGALILVAGLLLITPGVMTDVAGLSLLIPPVRKVVMHLVRRQFGKHVQIHTSGLWEKTTDETIRGGSTIVEGRVVDTHVVESSDEPGT